MKAEAIAKKIKLVCLDVDGVLTDGSIIISGQGELFKQFYVRDGLGIKFLQDCGIQVAICTGRQSDIVIERAQAGVSPEETAYMGDDIPDLCLFPLVALPCAPSDASVLALKKARWVSRFPGGHGAVRELAEFILKSQGLFEQAVMKRFNTEL